MISSRDLIAPPPSSGNNNGNGRGRYNGHNPRPFLDRDDMLKHMNDPRYSGRYDEQVKEFQNFVEECLGLSDAGLLGVGANADLAAAMAEQHQDWQDLGGDLDKDTSTYHSVAESQADMSSSKYKTDPYFREQVARKIARSTPDVPVTFEKHQSVKVGFLEGEEGEMGFVNGDGSRLNSGEGEGEQQ